MCIRDRDRASARISWDEDMTRCWGSQVSDDFKVGTSAVENPGQVLRVPVNRFAHTGVRLSLSNLGCLRLFPMVEHVTTLAGVHAVLPPHRYTQTELTAAFTEVCLGPDGNQALLERLCLLYTSPSPRDRTRSRMPSSA